MPPTWFRPRGYRHFDAPVGERFANKVLSPLFVERHAWSPLISYVKQQKRYKPKDKKTVFKDRDIMYASHRDACIMSRYSAETSRLLDIAYAKEGLSEAVIAYRSLGKSNYDFAARALAFARANAPCVIICFDVTGFFDNLDHKILKRRLADLLGGGELPADWYAVFKAVTKYRHVHRADLEAHAAIGPRLKSKSHEPVATIAEVVREGIPLLPGKTPGKGIPQGTPISATFSNLYMWDLDVAVAAACTAAGALYQRYSDDILIVCPPASEAALTKTLIDGLASLKLEVAADKTDRAVFDPLAPETVQYLGFNICPTGAVIRPGSLARQWRKARRTLRHTARVGAEAVAGGKATKVYTRKVRMRFLPVGVRNFSSYARRSAKVLGNKQIVRQVRRLERMVELTLRDMNR
ncbi:reverse transcriptase domain-containing protein [Caulobacter sp. UNC279MFTsu5.1]|uniref:reverse transcriptase domain-containing protein n=1 Tax=Caulobacter sp. UNC279MFTsu5.1 TaxID=1502775 RepID=UPI0008ED6238|nr:reverse transcriptase domain-containing protein [Caulobacter sp. UNC279MFTsu5.1]SFK75472.1 Reverse transcriptase (RNA-dependent DNA polymerase) [Caulobacter sp. UNC279MFTsu5.1]